MKWLLLKTADDFIQPSYPAAAVCTAAAAGLKQVSRQVAKLPSHTPQDVQGNISEDELNWNWTVLYFNCNCNWNWTVLYFNCVCLTLAAASRAVLSLASCRGLKMRVKRHKTSGHWTVDTGYLDTGIQTGNWNFEWFLLNYCLITVSDDWFHFNPEFGK